MLDDSSVDDAVPEKRRKEIRKCQYGHTFISKDEGSSCSFCLDLMVKFRDFASGKGGTLVSNFPDELVFFTCHRRDHPIFPLKASSIRTSPGLWCPLCNPKSRKHQISGGASDARPSVSLGESERRRMQARVEENRRDQARLLTSAKRLYKLTTSSSSRSVQSASILESVREQALADTSQYPEVSEVQSLLVRTILACREKPEECWSLIAMILEQPVGSVTQEKLFRKAAREVHPDKCKHGESAEAFKALNALGKKEHHLR